MDRLPLHIEYLLTRHDCVIVPGIGAFIASETEPRIDRERGVVVPRRREVSFNSSVVTDDGLLSHSIARREGLSYEEAHRLMKHLTTLILRDLQQEGETSIGRVGKLILSSAGTMEFIPRHSITEKDVEVEIPIADILARRKIFMEDPDRYVFSVSKRLVHAAAVVALLITVCLSVLIPYNHDQEQRASVMPVEDFLRHPLVIDVPDETVDLPSNVPSDSILQTKEAKIL